MNKRLLLVASAVTALAVAAGCGGGGGSSLTPTQASSTSNKSAQATMRIVIPAKTSASSSAKRSPQYISPDTGSVSFAVNGGTAQVVALGPGSSACTGSTSAGYVCTANFQAPVGTGQSVVVKTFQSGDASGTPLSQVTQTFNVSATGSNAITFTLGGVAASLTLALAPTSIANGTASSVTATWTALDAAGDTIIGPGALVDASGTALAVPTLASDATSGITIGTYTPVTGTDGKSVTGSWAVAYDGTTEPTSIGFTVSLTGVTAGAASLTVTGGATPSPPPSSNAIVNPGFEASSTSLAPWYACYAGHATLTDGIDATPPLQSPQPAVSQAPTNPLPAGNPSPAPNGPPSTTDVTIAQAMPAAAPYNVPHGGANAALVGKIIAPRTKGLEGVCQDVTVPTGNPSFSVWVWEGGNVGAFYSYDSEVDVFTGATWQPAAGGPDGAMETSSNPAATYFAETNCYNNQGTSGGSGTTNFAACNVPALQPPDSPGGQWRLKGPYDLSAYAGQQVTLLLGVWSSSTSTGYYDYAFFDDASLSAGSGPAPSPTPTAPVNITISGGAHR